MGSSVDVHREGKRNDDTPAPDEAGNRRRRRPSRLACWSVSNGIEMRLNLGPEMIGRLRFEVEHAMYPATDAPALGPDLVDRTQQPGGADRVGQLITETIPPRVAADTAFSNARRNSDRENTRIEHDRALLRVMTSLMKDDTELFKQHMDNPGFQRWMNDAVFDLACEQAAAG